MCMWVWEKRRRRWTGWAPDHYLPALYKGTAPRRSVGNLLTLQRSTLVENSSSTQMSNYVKRRMMMHCQLMPSMNTNAKAGVIEGKTNLHRIWQWQYWYNKSTLVSTFGVFDTNIPHVKKESNKFLAVFPFKVNENILSTSCISEVRWM